MCKYVTKCSQIKCLKQVAKLIQDARKMYAYGEMTEDEEEIYEY